jgi:hypothetical protein
MNAAAITNVGGPTPISALYENWLGLNILFPGA